MEGLHGYGSRRSRGLSFGSAGRTVNVWRIQPCLSDVRFTPMCGRLRVGKENLHVAVLVGAPA
jgi:hypothetical protein